LLDQRLSGELDPAGSVNPTCDVDLRDRRYLAFRAIVVDCPLAAETLWRLLPGAEMYWIRPRTRFAIH
jgi:hypothetical protein